MFMPTAGKFILRILREDEVRGTLLKKK